MFYILYLSKHPGTALEHSKPAGRCPSSWAGAPPPPSLRAVPRGSKPRCCTGAFQHDPWTGNSAPQQSQKEPLEVIMAPFL